MIEKTYMTQEKNDLTYCCYGDKVHQTIGLGGLYDNRKQVSIQNKQSATDLLCGL
jgi:hypothetical protein